MIETSSFTSKYDEQYMRQALQLAQQAAQAHEVPIGALVVTADGAILGEGYNQVEYERCQTEHAEIRAIRQACYQQKNWRLEGCTLYVTLEPCVMCVALASWSRISRIVYGASSPLFGYRLDREVMPALYMKHIKGVTSGVLADEASELLRNFFSTKRMNTNEQ